MFLNTPIRRQIYSILCGNLLTLSFGGTIGWAAVNFVALQMDDTTFPSGPLSSSQATRVVSMFFIGAMVGNLLLPYIVTKFGCKRTILALGCPQTMVWLLIIYARNPYYLYVSRFLTGLVSSGAMTCMPIFISETCNELRGTLISAFEPLENIGTAIGFFLGKYLNYSQQAMYQLIPTIAFVVLFAGIPQTPSHLVNVGKQKAAEKAHAFYKGFGMEKQRLAEDENGIDENTNLTFEDFTNHRARKAICIAFALVLLHSTQGFGVLLVYITDIFRNSSPNASSIDASILIIGSLIVANLIYMNLIDRVGRVACYVTSSFATLVGYISFAFYLHYLADDHAFDWIPIVAVAYALVAASLGMDPSPWFIMMEVLPKKTKIYTFPACIFIGLAMELIMSEIFPPVQECIGLIGWIIIFGVACFANGLFGLLVLCPRHERNLTMKSWNV